MIKEDVLTTEAHGSNPHKNLRKANKSATTSTKSEPIQEIGTNKY